MSNGEKTYKAVRDSVLAAVIESFDPDWDALVGDAYNAFIEDLRDDIKVDVEIGEEADLEMTIQPYILDEAHAPDLGKPISLSDLLFDSVSMYGRDKAIQALNNTLTTFYAKLEEQAA
jgi:hypothetical protein